MRRREFIALLGAATVARPLAARAQDPGRIPRIGFLADVTSWKPLRQSLRDIGYVEGQSRRERPLRPVLPMT